MVGVHQRVLRPDSHHAAHWTLLGFSGPKAEAEEIKQRLTTFLREELKLELSQDKTLITHARTQAAKFLGYEITVLHNDGKLTGGQRSVNVVASLRVPSSVIKAKQAPYLARGKPERRPNLLNEDDYTIVNVYGAEWRGVVQYYLRGYRHHTAWAAQVLRGQSRTQRQETTGRTVRWHSITTATGRGNHRSRAGSRYRPPHRAGRPAPSGTMRDLPEHRGHLGASHPETRRSRPAGTAATGMGGVDGQAATQDPRGLSFLPSRHTRRTADTAVVHVVITGEPVAVKAAHRVRAGGRWKRNRPNGKPRQRPTRTI